MKEDIHGCINKIACMAGKTERIRGRWVEVTHSFCKYYNTPCNNPEKPGLYISPSHSSLLPLLGYRVMMHIFIVDKIFFEEPHDFILFRIIKT